MNGEINEHERTMAFAEVALGQIRSLRQSAVPRNYEIWYVYATGYNPSLNSLINETLALNGKLTENDLEQIYETYLSQMRVSERIDSIGSRVQQEIGDVMNALADIVKDSDAFGNVLEGESKKLNSAKTPEAVRMIIEQLVSSTNDMKAKNSSIPVGIVR